MVTVIDCIRNSIIRLLEGNVTKIKALNNSGDNTSEHDLT